MENSTYCVLSISLGTPSKQSCFQVSFRLHFDSQSKLYHQRARPQAAKCTLVAFDKKIVSNFFYKQFPIYCVSLTDVLTKIITTII